MNRFKFFNIAFPDEHDYILESEFLKGFKKWLIKYEEDHSAHIHRQGIYTIVIEYCIDADGLYSLPDTTTLDDLLKSAHDFIYRNKKLLSFFGD